MHLLNEITRMRKNFLLLSVAAIPVIAPLWAPIRGTTPGRRAQVGEVPLPQLTPQQWQLLLQRQSADQKRLRIDLALSVDRGRVYDVTVRTGSDYPNIDSAIVNWIAANWKLAPWFVGGEDYVVSLEVDPTLRQVVFRNT
jgi:hypothetical protein